MLKLLKSGYFTTIQDSGRFGFRHIGVPVSGAMDHLAMTKVNSLLENEAQAAVMEITMTGPTILFEKPTHIALGGAEMSATLNDGLLPNYTVGKVRSGDILSFGALTKGFRAYLAVKGGFSTPVIMGSRSFYKGITPLYRLADGATVPFGDFPGFEPRISAIKSPDYLEEQTLIVDRGPEFDHLNDAQLQRIFGGSFKVAKENDRMAYQLQQVIPVRILDAMLTSGTLPGTVQMTPNGKLIILMMDGQTTGGYQRVLQLSDRALSILAQRRYGDSVSFSLRK